GRAELAAIRAGGERNDGVRWLEPCATGPGGSRVSVHERSAGVTALLRGPRRQSWEWDKMVRVRILAAGAAFALMSTSQAGAQSASCDAVCLDTLARDYRAAYRAHDPALAPFASTVRYTENNVEMPFPD